VRTEDRLGISSAGISKYGAESFDPLQIPVGHRFRVIKEPMKTFKWDVTVNLLVDI
jgi:hypothetical protein